MNFGCASTIVTQLRKDRLVELRYRIDDENARAIQHQFNSRSCRGMASETSLQDIAPNEPSIIGRPSSELSE